MIRIPSFKPVTSYLRHNPMLLGAALVAPIFFDSEDRGYFKTALVTTPAIFIGASLFKDGVFSKVKTEAKTVWEAAGRTSTILSQMMGTAEELSKFATDPSVNIETFERIHSMYSIANKPGVNNAPIGDLYTRVRGMLTVTDTNKGLLSDAILAASRDAMTAGDWTNVPKLLADVGSDRAPFMEQKQMEEILEFFQTRGSEVFPKSLQSNLDNVKGLIDTGIRIPTATAVVTEAQIPLDIKDWNWNTNQMEGFFHRANADKAGEMLRDAAEAAKASKTNLLFEVRLIAEAVPAKLTGDIYAMEFIRNISKSNPKGEVLRVSIPHPETGAVRMGPNGGYVGTGRSIVTPTKEIVPIHEWITRMVIEQPGFTTKQLQREIDAAIFFSSHDPRDKESIYSAVESGLGRTKPQARSIRGKSQSAVYTTLPLFLDRYDKNASFDDLDAIRQLKFNIDLFNKGEVSLMGPESGLAHRVVQLRRLEDLTFGGVAGTVKQDWQYRSLTKEMEAELTGFVPEHINLKSSLSTTAYDAILGQKTMPEFNMRIAGISPQMRTLLGGVTGKTWEDNLAYKDDFIRQAMEMGASPEKALDTFNSLKQFYDGPAGKRRNGASLFEQIGRLGEGDTLIHPDLEKAVRLKRTVTYETNTLNFNKEESLGKTVGKDFQIGNMNSRLVRPDQPGTLISADEVNGIFKVVIEERHELRNAKLDYGIKGEAHGETAQGDFSSIVDIINNVEDTLDLAVRNRIDKNEVSGLVDWSYAQNKMEALPARVSILEDTLRKMSAVGSKEADAAVEKTVLGLKGFGIDYVNEQMIWDHTKYDIERGVRIDRLLELNKLLDERFAEVSVMIANKKGFGNATHQAWSERWQTALGQTGPIPTKNIASSFEEYMLQNGVNVVTRAWGHNRINLGDQATVGYDLDTYLNLGEKHAITTEIRNRLLTVGGGDPDMTQRFGAYLHGNNYTKPMREKDDLVVNLEDAFMNDNALTRAEGRVGSIFDPNNSKYFENFRVKYIDQQGIEQFIPLPGTKAYNSISPQFSSPGEAPGYQTHSWQNEMQNLWQANKDKDYTKRDEIAAGMKQILDSGLADEKTGGIVSGKKGAFRPRSYDPLGRTGYITTRGGNKDPFTIGISREEFGMLPDAVKKGYKERGFVGYGLITRQPYSDAIAAKIVVDPHLSGFKYTEGLGAELVRKKLPAGRLFSITEAMRALLRSDDDLDPSTLHYFIPGTDAYKRAAEMALPGSQQSKKLEHFRALMGAGDEGSRVLKSDIKNLSQRAAKDIESYRNIEKAVINRSATEAIGALSIASGRMLAHLERSDAFKNDAKMRNFLNIIAFRPRQIGIDARKMAEHFDKEHGIKIAAMINDAFVNTNHEAAAEQLRDALIQTMPKVEWTPEMETHLGIKDPGKYLTGENVGQHIKINAAERFLSSQEGIDATLALMKGRRAGTNEFVDLMSGSLLNAVTRNKKLYESIGSIIPASYRKSWMAIQSAADIGNANAAKTAMASGAKIADSFREFAHGPAGKILGITALAAIGVGILTNKPRPLIGTTQGGRIESPSGAEAPPRAKAIAGPSFSRPSGNKYRPEEKIGSDGQIPGEPMVGSMGSTNPPRTSRPRGNTGVRTTVVAPMNRTSNLEMNVRTEDKRKAADLARAAAQMTSNGNVNTTVNYRVNNKLGSLRTREHIRDIRDES